MAHGAIILIDRAPQREPPHAPTNHSDKEETHRNDRAGSKGGKPDRIASYSVQQSGHETVGGTKRWPTSFLERHLFWSRHLSRA